MPGYVYDFAEAASETRDTLGGKGAALAEMTAIGLPVPDGFTISTQACRDYLRAGGVPEGLDAEVDAQLAALESRVGKRLGDPADPLLVSVRSGAPISMPGMMDTVLNLGMNDASVEGLAAATGDARFAYDSYRRFIQMFGNVVDGVELHVFEDLLANARRARGVDRDVDLDADDLRGLTRRYLDAYRSATGGEFPQQPREQLGRAIRAVFDSWNAPRARSYRRIEGIADDLGTAVNVQQMVFGNMGADSATGVGFSRDPRTGERGFFGEFLVNAQGEDVVAGIRTPLPLTELSAAMPEAANQLWEAVDLLERHYGDLQDFEFTIERGRLYLLQTRAGKRHARAALRVVRDMVEAGVLTREQALLRLDAGELEQVLRPMIDPRGNHRVIAHGLNASPGAAVGKVVFDAAQAEERGRAGEAVILVREETTAEDVAGMFHAAGVLTARGGMTSHAAVVARGWGKPCVVGAEMIEIDHEQHLFRAGDEVVCENDEIAVDGTAGTVILGAVELIRPGPDVLADLHEVCGWADTVRRLGVRANADNPADAARARELGAEGIGLCRTEHMFFSDTWLPVMREMIMAHDETGRREVLDRLLPPHQADFEGILRAMAGLPVTIRLLDPPLHEFVPDVEELHETNPMLGTRGCRLGLVHPEIYEMQVRAIVRAARAVGARDVEIMHPLVGFAEELRRLRELTERVVDEEGGQDLGIAVGTMIEVPRAALTADEIAAHADFFSFGTNDLTQMTLAFSRDDAEAGFLTTYLETRVLERSPFATLDPGVGRLIETAVGLVRGRPDRTKLGVCGEHGGDPRSIIFFESTGLDYVSCSPERVPTARVAAAQAVLGATAE
jgi:pyruvate,orthophosphate dikinase